ncbi:hypothetical protein FOL47_011068 [Perkinsus chesapeaki]|uniref:Uncharacterized protein n=1 Tax=Perkinsus chesapeaki TaxID=330153 RepID=A0A7J6MN76_PERCH|nr:hypothetical protein FOL47_011068 [Perkinsus chesapeaki]
MASSPTPPQSPRLPEVVEVNVDAALAKGEIRTGHKLKNWLAGKKDKTSDEEKPEKRHFFGKKKAQKGEITPIPEDEPKLDSPGEAPPADGIAKTWEPDSRENFKMRLSTAAAPIAVPEDKRVWLTHMHHYNTTFDGLEPGDRDFHRVTAILGPKKPKTVFEENGPCGAITLNAFSLKGVPRGILGGVRPYLMLHMACSGGKKRRAGRTARLMRYKKTREEYLCNESFVLHVYHPVTVLRLRVMLRRSALNMLGEDEVLDGLYCGRIKLSIRVDYLSKIDQICANFALPPEKLRHLPKYSPSSVYTSAMRIKELLWDKSFRDAFFEFKRVGRWDPEYLKVSVIPMVSWLAMCRWLPGNRLFGMINLLLVGIMARSYYRTKAKGRLQCLAGDKGDRDQAAVAQALIENISTIVPEKKKIGTSRRALDDLYGLPGFTKPAAVKDKKKQKNILKQNRNHRNLATGAVHGFTQAGGKITSGVAGVFANPVKGLQQDGAKGLIKGTALGLTGLVTGTVGGVAGAVAAVGAGAVNTGIALGRGTANVVGLGDECEDWSATESEESTDEEEVDDNADPLPEFQGSKSLGFVFFCSKFAPKDAQEGVRFLQRKMSKWIRITTEYTRILKWESDFAKSARLASIFLGLAIIGLVYPKAFGLIWSMVVVAARWLARPIIGLIGIELLTNGTRLPRTINRVIRGIMGVGACFGSPGLEKMKCFTPVDTKPEHIWQFDPHNNPDAFLEALKWRSKKAKQREEAS